MQSFLRQSLGSLRQTTGLLSGVRLTCQPYMIHVADIGTTVRALIGGLLSLFSFRYPLYYLVSLIPSTQPVRTSARVLNTCIRLTGSSGSWLASYCTPVSVGPFRQKIVWYPSQFTDMNPRRGMTIMSARGTERVPGMRKDLGMLMQLTSWDSPSIHTTMTKRTLTKRETLPKRLTFG